MAVREHLPLVRLEGQVALVTGAGRGRPTSFLAATSEYPTTWRRWWPGRPRLKSMISTYCVNANSTPCTRTPLHARACIEGPAGRLATRACVVIGAHLPKPGRSSHDPRAL